MFHRSLKREEEKMGEILTIIAIGTILFYPDHKKGEGKMGESKSKSENPIIKIGL